MDAVGLPRRLLAEILGTALLVTVVVGSGIAAVQLSRQDVGLQLLENSTATVFGLAVLILIFGPVSGAHFNPVVTAADWLLGRRSGTGISGGDALAYIAVQVVGGVCHHPANTSSARRDGSRIAESHREYPNTIVKHRQLHRGAGLPIKIGRAHV